ncbi:MAG: hypothetical protein HW421_1829 [Ignavibacteria bacterium]|nr:hypothetical protein [Ignavibacteria bacterium]
MKKLFFLFFIIFQISNSQFLIAQKQGQAKIDSLLKELPKAKEDTNKVNLLNSLTFVDIKPEEKLKYSEQALHLALKLGWWKGIADAYRNLGLNNSFDFPNALEYFFMCLTIREDIKNKGDIAEVNLNIGDVYVNLNDYSKTLEYFLKALNIYEEIRDKKRVSVCLERLGHLYSEQKDYPKTLEYFLKSLKIHEENNNKIGIAANLTYIGDVYRIQKNYTKALEYLFKALKIGEELSHKMGIVYIQRRIGLIYSERDDYLKAYEYFNNSLKMIEKFGDETWKGWYATIFKDFGELYLKYEKSELKNISKNNYFSKNRKENLNKAKDYLNKSLIIVEEFNLLNEILEIYYDFSEIFRHEGNFKSSLEFYKKHIELKDSLFGDENKKKINVVEAKRNLDIKEKERAIKLLERKNQQITQYSMIAGLAVLSFIVFYVVYASRKSEKLLLNVLPKIIAKRLKKKEHPIADHFDEASVVFIDIVNFTQLSTQNEAKRVADVLNKLYSKLDHLAKKHGLEKIKTIGDCYMAAVGIPVKDPDYAIKAASFAIEAMSNFQLTDSTEPSDDMLNQLQFRCGIDCGPVVAGVIGEHKFIYDIWGDTVNTAARMEEYSEPGRIQVTERFKEALSHPMTGSHRMTFEERGEIEIKGKGMMRTYFLNNLD